MFFTDYKIEYSLHNGGPNNLYDKDAIKRERFSEEVLLDNIKNVFEESKGTDIINVICIICFNIE